MKRDNINKKDLKEIGYTSFSVVFGVFWLALCYNLFLIPNNLVVGGLSGLAIILNQLFNLNIQIFIYITSFILLIVSYLVLGKEETKRTLIGSILYPLFITFTEPIAKIILLYLTFEETLILVLIAALLYGFSNGIIYKYGYSTGGLDIVMKILCKYFYLSEGKSIMILNLIVILIGAFTFGIDKGIYSIIILVISSLIIDKIIMGISDSKKFMIYTKNIRKITNLIQDEFKTGYTTFPTVGGYSHIGGVMIMCVIRNRDINLFKSKILDIDPKAFFVVNDCYTVQGGIKRSNLPFL